MKRFPIQIILPLVACIILVPRIAAAENQQRISCPMLIPEADMVAPKAPEGWKSSVMGPAHINRIEVTMGPPEQRVVLKPKHEPKGGGWVGDRWTGLRSYRNPDEDGVWMSCVYGSSGNLGFTRRLNDKVEQCRAIYQLDTARHNKSVELICTW